MSVKLRDAGANCATLSITIGLLFCLTLSAQALGQDGQSMGTDFAISRENVPEARTTYSPFVGYDYPNRVYWGDSHLHTSYSWDAGLVGNTLGPDEAYRFAKGEQIMASSGQLVKLVRPLDWLVVAVQRHHRNLSQPAD